MKMSINIYVIFSCVHVNKHFVKSSKNLDTNNGWYIFVLLLELIFMIEIGLPIVRLIIFSMRGFSGN